MKRFIWLVLLVAAGYAVWKYYPEIERMARQRTGLEEKGQQNSESKEIPDSLPASSAIARGRTPAPAAPGGIQSADEEAIAQRFPMPAFKPIDELVGGWKKIPTSAFPRQVTLKAPVTLKLTRGAGTSTMEAGRTVYALAGTAEGELIVAPSPDAVMRGTVPMEATDFQAVMESVYEQFKTRVRGDVERRRELARQELLDAQSGTPIASTALGSGDAPSPEILAVVGPKPRQNEDFTVPIVQTSISERQKTRKHAEPPAGAKLGWSPLRFRQIDGQPYWVVGVRYTARTIFGEFPAEALALIRDGKVIRWIYAGTGEPLP